MSLGEMGFNVAKKDWLVVSDSCASAGVHVCWTMFIFCVIKLPWSFFSVFNDVLQFSARLIHS